MSRTLMLVYGPPGSGKSTLCAAVAERLPGAVLLSSAELRRGPRFAGRLLDTAARTEILAVLVEQADEELTHAAYVIVDTNCMDVTSRAAFIAVAAGHGAAAVLVKCMAPPTDIEARVRRKPESATTPLREWLRFVEDRLVDPNDTERASFATAITYDSGWARTGPAVTAEPHEPADPQVRRLLGVVAAVADSHERNGPHQE